MAKVEIYRLLGDIPLSALLVFRYPKPIKLSNQMQRRRLYFRIDLKDIYTLGITYRLRMLHLHAPYLTQQGQPQNKRR